MISLLFAAMVWTSVPAGVPTTVSAESGSVAVQLSEEGRITAVRLQAAGEFLPASGETGLEGFSPRGKDGTEKWGRRRGVLLSQFASGEHGPDMPSS